mmetsp:Transcript_7899/g.28126  ORF Transcript_7899/g.28126 Transcript_7899/m.28126 type:complete len:338 (-) Transcript_7899:41-1054(-)
MGAERGIRMESDATWDKLSVRHGHELGLEVGLLLLVRKLARLPKLLLRRLRPLLALRGWIFPDGFVHLAVHVFQAVRIQSFLQILGEVLLVLVWIFFFHLFHVLGDVTTDQVFAQHLVVQLLLVRFIPYQTLLVVRHVHATVARSFHDGKHTCTGGRAYESSVEERRERSPLGLVVRFDVVIFAVRFFFAHVDLVQSELLQHATCHQQTHAVCGGVVGESHLESIPWQFCARRRADDHVAGQRRLGHLRQHLLVAEPRHEAVLGCTVLVLVLQHQAGACTVVGLAFAPTSKLDLVPLEVRLGLGHLHHRHLASTDPRAAPPTPGSFVCDGRRQTSVA